MSTTAATGEKPMAFVARCKTFFGMKEGQNLSAFMAEVNQLTDADKKELAAAFNAQGMPTLEPTPKA